MQVTVENTGPLERRLTVQVPADEVQKQVDSRLREIGKQVRIKGFRPGKVPVPHLKRVYGKSAMAEVVQKTIDDQSKAVLADRNLKRNDFLEKDDMGRTISDAILGDIEGMQFAGSEMFRVSGAEEVTPGATPTNKRFTLVGVGVARQGDTFWITQIFLHP